ncbi:unnamed protein product [Aphanomyces euteiches]|uniref:RxLR effector protein n=1 Tax=Aphanomyces euteiches TaxID=100861 RepID=A0A6G0W6X6_9STRA|nr:hypothetical protein Ae201684_018871 [Aphanomyces euteiches]KAH9086013.1 hypothetical protein Ae201684P_005709 [Aphanomyces euteiches]KAH9095302.1 hypothetical protein Ae201684P_013418 [Aphanomyces euteiches]KAH9142670.1 hypothetical protein AeRB84_013272 [Aphanomyces euteiches]
MRATSVFFACLVVVLFVFSEAKHPRQYDDQEEPEDKVVYVQKGKKAKKQMFSVGTALGAIKVGTAIYGMAKNHWGHRKLIQIDAE